MVSFLTTNIHRKEFRPPTHTSSVIMMRLQYLTTSLLAILHPHPLFIYHFNVSCVECSSTLDSCSFESHENCQEVIILFIVYKKWRMFSCLFMYKSKSEWVNEQVSEWVGEREPERERERERERHAHRQRENVDTDAWCSLHIYLSILRVDS